MIVTSAKKTFFAGGDLETLIRYGPDDAAAAFEHVTRIKGQLRRLETLGLPVVAAMNGTALGGGLEIALACHHRIGLDAPGVVYGLPEVTLGLLPGAGGVTRITRMLGIADGFMKVLGQGQRHKPAAALEIGIVDELVTSREEMLARARAWIEEQVDRRAQARQPWDTPGYRIPGGTPSTPQARRRPARVPGEPAQAAQGRPGARAAQHPGRGRRGHARSTWTPRCASRRRYFVDLVTGQVAKNMTKAFFFDLQAINGGASRPAGYERWAPTKVAVLGAGMMGAGIAYSCALAGWEVVLKDVSLDVAARGKAYSEGLVAKGVQAREDDAGEGRGSARPDHPDRRLRRPRRARTW